MIKKLTFNSCQRAINRLKPGVHVALNLEMPTPSLREVAEIAKIVAKVNAFEEALRVKPDSFFAQQTKDYRVMIQERTKSLSEEEYVVAVEEILDEVLPFYFACVREAARRTVKMRHFDVQLLGGVVLHKNKIAEMVTGEGKTLVATLAASLNALPGRGVHVVTVNDYLANRDREWMGAIYEFLGLSVGVIQQDMDKLSRRNAYNCDITYGTNNEFGFDYLRDNMVTSLDEMVQRKHWYAIIDEVDSILVDEARTPLIISGPAEVSIDKYYRADQAVRKLKTKRIIQSFDNKDGTVTVKSIDGTQAKVAPEEFEEKFDAISEEKTNNAYLTGRGEKRCEEILGIESVSDDSPDKFSSPWSHYLNQSLRAHNHFLKDRHYIVKDGKVVIVDDFTGRLMPGRRWSDGLHQAVEAKENLRIQQESQTLATVTLQNYFRMYNKLAGMTGTAYTEANEFRHIYKLDVVVLPTNTTLIRQNLGDRIYKSKQGKFEAVIAEVLELYEKKRPVLVGTTSIEDSEQLSFLLGNKGVPHNVLNAKHHEREAHIVAQAGRLGQVTIATNMAGRGTDIILGGNLDFFIKDLLQKNGILPDDPQYHDAYQELSSQYEGTFQEEHNQVVSLGGVHVIGTQRHEARRIDNQLRGRSGRQGDPGSSRFYVSLEDDLMRLFGSERIYGLMERLGFPEDQPIEHPLINRSMEVAQRRVEGHNFEIRKHLLEYDNVMNKQRELIYQQRRQLLENAAMAEEVADMIDEIVARNIPLYFGEETDVLGLLHWVKGKYNVEIDPKCFSNVTVEEGIQMVTDVLHTAYRNKEAAVGKEQMEALARMAALWAVDTRWKEHLLIIDSLKEGIHLRGYAQTEPLVAYQKETYFAFQEMIASIKEGIVELVFKARAQLAQETVGVFKQAPQNFVHSEYTPLAQEEPREPAPPPPQEVKPRPQTPEGKKVGRNDPCPCGSGKKYKKCCGR